ncbi:MAG: hypothetical protein WD269_09335 [Acidimicrobiia bacterium]
MTTTDQVLGDWATHPFGKAARVAMAVGGMLTGVMLMLIAPAVHGQPWLLVIVATSLVITSVRAARFPSVTRLALVAANLLAMPLLTNLT